eukprot:9141030-Alexandrium_andersonii.AAC.1
MPSRHSSAPCSGASPRRGVLRPWRALRRSARQALPPGAAPSLCARGARLPPRGLRTLVQLGASLHFSAASSAT